MTLRDGIYNVSLSSGGSNISFGLVRIRPGTTTRISTDRYYDVNFTEYGLPKGAIWGISLYGIPHSSENSTFSIMLQNGTYNFTVLAVPGYVLNSTSDNFTVKGGNLTVDLKFRVVRYAVTFHFPLTSGSFLWNLSMTGIGTFSTLSEYMIFYLPNGSYRYTANTTDPAYLNATGEFTVDGGNLSVIVSFTQKGHLIIHTDNNNSTIIINGKPHTIISEYSSYLDPGQYTIFLQSTGFYPFFDFITILPGQNATFNANLTPMHGYGFLSGTISPGNVSVYASGVPIPVADGRFNQSLPAGTYLVSFSAQGFEPQLQKVLVITNETQGIQVNLIQGRTFKIAGRLEPAYSGIMFNFIPAEVNSSGFF